ncbi:hypothetical protein KSX_79560 [Ktedonospora formicarum]|uniref:HTH luxR-type domain-containing protein n=1 Tax=Ktedonospora formicarum TaxID=2778364 RepID=A0A8J3I9P2_9CHLR|nr:hypothetical protein KSX_79560 [Ktedonospora formicarum]
MLVPASPNAKREPSVTKNVDRTGHFGKQCRVTIAIVGDHLADADDLSNTQIAARLVISECTVKSHVNNVLSKLHIGDRTQAAIYAWREGFMYH